MGLGSYPPGSASGPEAAGYSRSVGERTGHVLYFKKNKSKQPPKKPSQDETLKAVLLKNGMVEAPMCLEWLRISCPSPKPLPPAQPLILLESPCPWAASQGSALVSRLSLAELQPPRQHPPGLWSVCMLPKAARLQNSVAQTLTKPWSHQALEVSPARGHSGAERVVPWASSRDRTVPMAPSGEGVVRKVVALPACRICARRANAPVRRGLGRALPQTPLLLTAPPQDSV